MDSPRLIVNAAITGMIPTRKDNPNVPVTPDEIAEDTARCRQAGASIVHLHARDADEKPTWRPDVYAEIVSKVRARTPDVIVCVSCSGRNFREFEKRSAVLDLEGDLKPEMASLTLGSMNFPREPSVNDPAMIQSLAAKMRERGIVPELEVFDMGMIDYMKYLIERKILVPPFYVNILLGSLGTLSATPFHLSTITMGLPSGMVWAAAGIGRFQFPMNSLAIAMGGNVRVGIEDNIFYDTNKERPASNPGLIARLAKVAAAVEREIATPAEARSIIGLPTPPCVLAAKV